MKNFVSIFSIVILSLPAFAQQSIPVADNLVTDGIPALPITYVSDVKNYTESRAASFGSALKVGE